MDPLTSQGQIVISTQQVAAGIKDFALSETTPDHEMNIFMAVIFVNGCTDWIMHAPCLLTDMKKKNLSLYECKLIFEKVLEWEKKG